MLLRKQQTTCEVNRKRLKVLWHFSTLRMESGFADNINAVSSDTTQQKQVAEMLFAFENNSDISSTSSCCLATQSHEPKELSVIRAEDYRSVKPAANQISTCTKSSRVHTNGVVKSAKKWPLLSTASRPFAIARRQLEMLFRPLMNRGSPSKSRLSLQVVPAVVRRSRRRNCSYC